MTCVLFLGLNKDCSESELRDAYKKLGTDRCSATSGNSKSVEEAKNKFQQSSRPILEKGEESKEEQQELFKQMLEADNISESEGTACFASFSFQKRYHSSDSEIINNVGNSQQSLHLHQRLQ
ncbi:uncharacterized protein LOC129289364 [Prosopis cineraria]|uniref:uncharacterized protein LOC129289364 n=1 Tax=Prosopis cineraria TaxID=364024 RepID=UPI002410016D|nr:uncharacterized protein LOC129289364 [Prosopis cineraria]